MLRDPARVAVTPVASTVERITQRIIQVDHSAKPALLAQLLKQEQVNRALIFTRTKHGADKVVKGLARAGITADAIHGNKSQNHRERVLAAFRSGEIRTLVATDIAARGIDVDGISHVVNFDLPNVPETYVHRIGRTARAGADGVAISLVAGRGNGLSARHRKADPHHAAQGRPPHAGSSRRGTGACAAPRRALRAARACGQGAMKPHRDRKGLAVTAVPVVIMALRKPTGTRPTGMSRRVPSPQGGGKAEGMQGVAFLHRESRPNTRPNRTQRPR